MTQIAILMENETTFLFFLNAFFSWLFSPGMTVFLLWIGVNVFLHRLGSLYILFSPIFEDMEVAVGHNQDKSGIECELYPSVGSSWDFNDLVYLQLQLTWADLWRAGCWCCPGGAARRSPLGWRSMPPAAPCTPGTAGCTRGTPAPRRRSARSCLSQRWRSQLLEQSTNFREVHSARRRPY